MKQSINFTGSEFIDQLHRKVQIVFPPQRIISIVPSQTELLFDLGLRNEVVGITKFCVHPNEWFRSKTRVGGTKKLNFETIEILQPDLIIGNKEENDEQQIKLLMEKYPVWMSDIKNLDDALDMISRIGELVNKKESAVDLNKKIATAFSKFQTSNLPDDNRDFATLNKLQTAYLIWLNPTMVAGHDTFINDMMTRVGLKNVFADRDSRYPEITSYDFQKTNPELILLSSEPFPFKQKHVDEFKSILPKSKVMWVDGEMFSWYGSRLLKSAEYLTQFIHDLNT